MSDVNPAPGSPIDRLTRLVANHVGMGRGVDAARVEGPGVVLVYYAGRSWKVEVTEVTTW